MNRNIKLTFALVLTIISASLMSSDSNVQAAKRYTFDTGKVKLGPNQILRIAVDPTDESGNTVFFRRIGYTQSGCEFDGVCRHTPLSQMTTAPITLMPNEAASFEIPSTGSGVRGILVSSQKVTVNALIIDVATGNVNGIIAILIG